MVSTKDTADGKGGRKEVLTIELAEKIVRLVQRLPDAEIAVTWENVVSQVNIKFGHVFGRNVLSTKEWNGRKLIAEAFSEAKAVEKRMHRQKAPKYANSARSALQRRIAELEAKVLALKDELEATRAHQYDELHVLWGQNTDLHKMLGAKDKKGR
jgi:Flp pilus assembly protein CpaB